MNIHIGADDRGRTCTSWTQEPNGYIAYVKELFLLLHTIFSIQMPKVYSIVANVGLSMMCYKIGLKISPSSRKAFKYSAGAFQ